MNKKILLILLFFFMFLLTRNIFSYQIYYSNQSYIPNITITPYLYNTEFLAGQNITGYVLVQNNDPYYYPQIFLGIMLVKENSSFGTQVLFAELKMISNLFPYENYTVNFSYQIPENISSGNYEFLFYLYTATKHIIGNPNNFFTPVYKKIYISNPDIGNYPWISIARNQTELTNNNGILNLNLSLYSLYNTNATINIKLAGWDAILYGAIYNNSLNVELNKGYNYIYIDNINVSNLYSGIYYILIEVYSKNLLQDLYIIPYYVYGRSLSFNGIYLSNNGTLLVILSTYPNNNKNHILYNVGLTIYSNNQNFQDSINIGNLMYNSTEYIYIYDNVPMINGEDLCFNLTYQKEINGITYLSNICYTYYLTNQTCSSSNYDTEIKVIVVLVIVAGLVIYLLMKK